MSRKTLVDAILKRVVPDQPEHGGEAFTLRFGHVGRELVERANAARTCRHGTSQHADVNASSYVKMSRAASGGLLRAVDGKEMVLLHGFVKKEQRTPDADLALAEPRWSEWKRGQGQ